ncbi:MAG TPA: two-component regulator propeller domain-containing protein, partial [Bacteroidia bacterium]|nr:two-component regulator propeller domain-containing protein [Bacteroidia bacterium]
MNRRLHTPNTTFLQLFCVFCFIALTSTLPAQIYNFKTFSLDEGLSQSEITCIMEDSRGYLWLGTAGGGVCQFDGKNFQVYEQKDGVSGQLITSLTEDKKGNILIGATWGGLCSYNGKKFNILPTKEFIPSDHFDQIGRDNQDNLVLCTRGVVASYDGQHFRMLSGMVPEMKDNSVLSMYRDKKGRVWLGTQTGILLLQDQELHVLHDPTLPKGAIISFTGDDEGSVWFAQPDGKIYKITLPGSAPPEHWKASRVDTLPLPGSVIISGIHADRKGQFWVTTSNDGIYKYAKGHWIHFDINSGLPINSIHCMYEDRSGCFWFGTNGSGLIRFMDQTFTYYDNLEGFREKDIFGLSSDRQNTIWAGSSSRGIYSYDGHTITSYASVPGLKGFIARTIYCDKKGKLWFGGPQGIRQYDGQHFHTITIMPDSTRVNPAVFAEDSYGNMWIGTRGQGAFRYDGKKTEHFGQTEGLKNPYVYSICEDNSGAIWLGTGNNAYRYAQGKFQAFGSEAGICNPYIGS